MREIKFRAWNKKLKHMVYPDALEGISISDMGWRIGIFVDHHCGELMQYTGLKDKHGKEIYEGDIVIWESDPDWHSKVKHTYIIRYGEMYLWTDESYGGSVGFYLIKLNDNKISDPTKFGLLHLNHVGIKAKVIGNIYQNTELLK